MKLNYLYLLEVGNLEEQYRRPYIWNRDGDFVNNIIDIVDRRGDSLTAGSFNDIAASTLTLTTDDVERATMPDIMSLSDWRDKRFRFVMDLTLAPFSKYSNAQTRAIVQGYTDHADISHGDKIDPRMKMHINSVTMVKDIRNRGRISTRVISMEQTLLNDVDFGEELIRPGDIFTQIDLLNDSELDDYDIDDRLDVATSFVGGIQLNDRRSNSSANYLSRLINSDLTARENLTTLPANDDMIANTRDSIAEEFAGSTNILRNNKLLRALQQHRDDFKYDNTIRYRDIIDFMGGDRTAEKEVDRLTEIFEQDLGVYESNRMDGASAEIIAAVNICHVIPIIMLDCLMDTASFIISNEECRSGDVDFDMIEFTSMVGEDFDDHNVIRVFEQRLRREVFDIVSNRGEMTVDIEVDCEIYGVTIIKIEIDGDGQERFVFPSFADAMLTPIVTCDRNAPVNLAEGFIEIRESVDEIISRKSNVRIDTSTDISSARRDRDRRRGTTDRERGSSRRTSRTSRARSNDSLIDDNILGNGFSLKSLEDL